MNDRWVRISLLVASCVALSLSAQTTTNMRLEGNLSLLQKEFTQGNAVEVTFTLTNRGTQTVQLLPWITPLEGSLSEPFRITKDGIRRRFFGAYALRVPTPEAYVTIEPGRSVSHTVDLSKAYDLSEPGTYIVTLKRPVLHDVRPGGTKLAKTYQDLKPLAFSVNAVELRMLDRGVAPPALPRPPHKQRLLTSPCTPNPLVFAGQSMPAPDEDAMTQGYNAAVASVCNDSSFASTCPWPSNTQGLAQTYFGNCAAANAQNVSDIFVAMPGFVANSNTPVTINYNGTCPSCTGGCSTAGVLAFVCGPCPNTVFVCDNLVTSYNPVGPGSSGTGFLSIQFVLVHEFSHFAGTSDYAYGCPDCATLATSNPEQAANNADSIRIYGELQQYAICNLGVEHGVPYALAFAALFFGVVRLRLRQWLK